MRRRCQIQYVSDLHLEVAQQYDKFDIPPKAPFLVLAGDIGRLIDYDGYLNFLMKQCGKFRKIFLVLGNHEFYGTSRASGLLEAQRLVNEPTLNGTVVLLEKRRYDIEDSNVIVLGCTLHSSIPIEKREIVNAKIQDFQKIRNWTIDEHNDEHFRDVKWLQSEIEKIRNAEGGKTARIVVVTHHAPVCNGTSRPEHSKNPWSSAFATDLVRNEKFEAFADVRVWIFGHTHFTNYMHVGKVKIISNQRGYVFPGAPSPKPDNARLSQRLCQLVCWPDTRDRSFSTTATMKV